MKHGKELLRVEREETINDPNQNITWRCRTVAYMANGKVLQKTDVRFKPDAIHRTGEFYSLGWKVRGTLKAEIDPEQKVAKVLQTIAENPEKGWKVVKGAPPAVVISVDQIMAAIESGDNIGICKACGEEQGGCEPDARNYECESCGQREVYGAEEMLLEVAA